MGIAAENLVTMYTGLFFKTTGKMIWPGLGLSGTKVGVVCLDRERERCAGCYRGGERLFGTCAFVESAKTLS